MQGVEVKWHLIRKGPEQFLIVEDWSCY